MSYLQQLLKERSDKLKHEFPIKEKERKKSQKEQHELVKHASNIFKKSFGKSKSEDSDSESDEEKEHPLIRKAPFELRYQIEGYKTLEAWKKSPKYKAEEKIKAPLKKFQRKQESLDNKASKASKEETYKKYMTELFNLENDFFNNLEPNLFEEWKHLRITRPENKRHEFLFKNQKPINKTRIKTKKYHIPEPHAQKVEDIKNFINNIDYAHIKNEHKKHTDYLNSISKMHGLKTLIKKHNKYDKKKYLDIVPKPKEKNIIHSEFSEVIGLLQKALEKGTHTKELQNAIKYIKKFK